MRKIVTSSLALLSAITTLADPSQEPKYTTTGTVISAEKIFFNEGFSNKKALQYITIETANSNRHTYITSKEAEFAEGSKVGLRIQPTTRKVTAIDIQVASDETAKEPWAEYPKAQAIATHYWEIPVRHQGTFLSYRPTTLERSHGENKEIGFLTVASPQSTNIYLTTSPAQFLPGTPLLFDILPRPNGVTAKDVAAAARSTPRDPTIRYWGAEGIIVNIQPVVEVKSDVIEKQ